ncbi:MAG: DUF2946 domain-containing protein [Telluria sp.]
MGTLRIDRRIAAWIACTAFLLAALVPSMNHLLAAVHGARGDWVEVCSIDGVRLVNTASAQDASSSADKDLHHDHCPFCLTDAGLPPAGALALPPARTEARFPSLFYQSPRPLFTWASAQPRAPPTAS